MFPAFSLDVNTVCYLHSIFYPYSVISIDDVQQALTVIHHGSESPTVVNGYSAAGSYVRPINYGIKEREHWDALINRATECEQYIRYRCWDSRLLSDAGRLGT